MKINEKEVGVRSFFKKSFTRALSSVHTTAYYSALNGRLFNEKSILSASTAKSRVFYTA